jgi:hypothetical protein
MQPLLNRSEREGYLVEDGAPMSLEALADITWKNEVDLDSEIQQLVRFRLLKRDEDGVIFDPWMVADKLARSNEEEENMSPNGDLSPSGDKVITHKSRVEESRADEDCSNSTSTGVPNAPNSSNGTPTSAPGADALAVASDQSLGTTSTTSTDNSSTGPTGSSSERQALDNPRTGSSTSEDDLPPQVVAWCNELAPEFHWLNVRHVARKWVAACEESHYTLNKNLLRKWLENEDPAKDKRSAKKKQKPAKSKKQKKADKVELSPEEKQRRAKEAELKEEERKQREERARDVEAMKLLKMPPTEMTFWFDDAYKKLGVNISVFGNNSYKDSRLRDYASKKGYLVPAEGGLTQGRDWPQVEAERQKAEAEREKSAEAA